MKSTRIYLSAVLSLSLLGVTGCADWLEPASINDTDFNKTSKSEEELAALREWKQTPGLPQVFVWFDNWTGTSPTGANSLTGLPDSVTIASNWASSGADTTTKSRTLTVEGELDIPITVRLAQKVDSDVIVSLVFSQEDLDITCVH